MYVILVNEDNTLVTTQKENIMQRSKLVDDLWFLVPPEYKGYNMAEFTVLMEYILPVSRKYRSDILSLSAEKYNEHLKYTLPFDTELTREAGDVEVQLTFALVELDADGNPIQRVRKTSADKIHITPISAWSDIIPDDALSAIDQRLIVANAQIRALAELADSLSEQKADNFRYNESNGELQLMSGANKLGDAVKIISCIHADPDGNGAAIPIVHF
jgi:hypothetical protein|nr:MAG TPA: hypothetical protein [Bacteriophage sp.]